MSKHKRGKVLRSDERELVYNVIKYFDAEKDAKKYQPYGQSEERSSMATGLPVTAISKIKKEGPLVQQSSSKPQPKTTKERKRRAILNHEELCAFREIIEQIYEEMEVPTVRKILMNARKQLNFEGSRARVRGILKNKLGFKFNKRHPNKNVVLERNSIKAWRATYLRCIRENDALGDNKKPVVYVGELVINTPSSSEKATKRQTQKWMISHAGYEKGFIKGAALVYNFKHSKEKPKAREFLKYVEENLIPRLPKNCIVVMYNSTRHNMDADNTPTMFSSKEDIKKWMVDRYIPFEDDWYKAEMLMCIKKTHPVKKYAVDKLLEKYGHTVQRLPPFNTDLNPIEYIWTKIKARVSEENVKDDATCDLIRQAIELINEKDWQEQTDLVKKIEERYWLRDVVKEDDYDDLVRGTGLLSDSDSDTGTEYEYSWSSSSSEESDSEDSEADWTDIE